MQEHYLVSLSACLYLRTITRAPFEIWTCNFLYLIFYARAFKEVLMMVLVVYFNI